MYLEYQHRQPLDVRRRQILSAICDTSHPGMERQLTFTVLFRCSTKIIATSNPSIAEMILIKSASSLPG